jgi:hypothetical protein
MAQDERATTLAIDDVREDPREHCDWRRHKNGCPYYRERWFPHSDPTVGEPMYQVFCLKNTPPISLEEQEKCLSSRTRCWRLIELEARRPARESDERVAARVGAEQPV